MKKILNNKGSAMVLVLSSLIILMAVSAVVMMLSVANISMSHKYSNWSKEYYSLDKAAQEKLGEFDQNVLMKAETVARYYLQNSYYSYASVGEFPSSSNENASFLRTGLSDELQAMIYDEYWNNIHKYIAYPDPSLEGSDPEYTAYDEDQYTTLMSTRFLPHVFETLYYAYVSGEAEPNSSDNTDHTITTTLTPPADASWFPNVASAGSFEAFYDELEDMEKPQVEIESAENVTDGKKVNVLLTVLSPSYSAVEQTKYFAFKANPLYTNALSVQGKIVFSGSGSIDITGDVVANNQSGSGASLGMGEGTATGILTSSGSAANVTIMGNVYTNGDLHLLGTGSSIAVQSYPDGLSDEFHLKTTYLYSNDNEYYCYTSDLGDIGDFEENNTAGHIPYVYKDNTGGNVYCNNLAIEDGVQNGTLRVDGDVWTKDDIQNDGQTGAHINVQGNYIGLSSSAVAGDPNGSSAIVNNARLYSDSGIRVGTSSNPVHIVVPGVVFYELDNGTYYRTAESVSAKGGEFFETYLEAAGPTYTIDGVEYQMKDQTGFTPLGWIDELAGTIMGKPLDSKVSLVPADWYSLGAMIGSGTSYYEKNVSNQTAYSTVSGAILPTVFERKTKTYGTNGSTFSELTVPNGVASDSAKGFYYYSGSASVNVGTTNHGIIYCAGNLTLTGSGTFRGSIICAGNLTVPAGVNIEYDEPVIREVLGLTLEPDGTYGFVHGSGSVLARRFFSPGELAVNLPFGMDSITTISTNAGERDSDSPGRYQINRWKESRQ